MSISTTYQIISKNETYSLSWPTHLVFDETVANEEPIVGILTHTSEIELYDEEGNNTGVTTVTDEDDVRCLPENFEPESAEVFLYSSHLSLTTGVNTTTEYWAIHPDYTYDKIATAFYVPDENSVDRYDGDLEQLAAMSEEQWCNLQFENDTSLQTKIGTNYTFMILEQNETLRGKYLSTSTSPNNVFLVEQLGLKPLTTEEHNILVALHDGGGDEIAGVGISTEPIDDPDNHSIPTTP
tara:strand:+ start:1620 stop:2336 length:717 start_codon:yes stop_codon:yes gene_type:complete